MSDQPTLETWEMKVKRLAIELRDARPDPFKSSPKQRARYTRVRYALQLAIEEVSD